MTIQNLFISFSGGRTSAYMLIKILEEIKAKNPVFDLLNNDPLIAFANTGLEHPKTLDFVKKVSEYVLDKYGLKIHYLEAGGVIKEAGKKYRTKLEPRRQDFLSLSRKGEPAFNAAEEYGAFGMATPHCTREMKLAPLNEFASYAGKNTIQALGIRADEAGRVKLAPKKWYPLATEWPTTKEMVLEFWRNMPFDLNIEERHGNCLFCFKKGWNKLIANAREFPHDLDLMESIYKRGCEVSEKQNKPVLPYFRGYKTFDDLRNEVKDGDQTDISCDCGDDLTIEQVNKLSK
jgi:3'-phosphoadenosine 5'-phosphosulfate sulfotransferase (PAPS reductase)/FAD synthetase